MRDRVTFIHAADLHLDAPFSGIGADDPRVGRALAEATYEAWRAVVDLAIERNVEFVIVAGDAYNAAERSPRARYRFREQLIRLDDAGISAFIVHGNHDPLQGSASSQALPPSAHVFRAGSVERVEAVRDGDFVCAIYGRSFGKRAETTDFTPGYRRESGDTVAIGVLHANVGSIPEYDPYAPCTLEGLRARGLDYWALGHIHKFEVVSQDPWAVYAGSPQGLNPKETGEHGACVVEVGALGVTSFEHVPLSGIRWRHATVDVTQADDIDEVHELLTRACDEVRAEADGAPAIARMTLVGRTKAHHQIVRRATFDELVEDVRLEEISTDPWVWLDKVTDRTQPALDVDAIRAGSNFGSELVRIVDGLLADEESAGRLLDEVAAPVVEKLVGYTPGFSAAEALAMARDRCLDLLFAEGGGA